MTLNQAILDSEHKLTSPDWFITNKEIVQFHKWFAELKKWRRKAELARFKNYVVEYWANSPEVTHKSMQIIARSISEAEFKFKKKFPKMNVVTAIKIREDDDN